jgi:hypothetical protein
VIPNLLLAGAPKCGTTSIYDWLVEHPAVSGALKKEIFYLIDKGNDYWDSGNNYDSTGVEGYQKYFNTKAKIIVDGTTHSIYQDSAISYAKEHNSKAVFFLRNPSDRVFSAFRYYRDTRTLIPKETTFAEFLSNVTEDENYYKVKMLDKCLIHSDYEHYLSKWYASIGENNIKVFLFEDLVNQPAEVMKGLCEFLSIDYSFFKNFEFDTKNESKSYKYRRVNKLKEKLSRFVPDGSLKNTVSKMYSNVNSMPKLKTSEEEKLTKASLNKKFADSIVKLESLIKIDLTCWK